MPKIAFKATGGMLTYIDRPKSWADGDVRDVDKARAEYLLKTHPANFYTADQFKAMQQKAEAAAAAQAAKNKDRLPSGDPRSSQDQTGDTTGAPIDQLTEAEIEQYNVLAKKIDNGEKLTKEEQALFDRVETLMADGASGESED